jgi:nucleoside-diphosphate-sugar epimerase
LASNREISIKDLAQMINKAASNAAEISFKKRRTWDTKPRLLACIEKAKRLIDYKPIENFEEGLGKTIEWFNDNWQTITKLADFPPGMNSAVRDSKSTLESSDDVVD